MSKVQIENKLKKTVFFRDGENKPGVEEKTLRPGGTLTVTEEAAGRLRKLYKDKIVLATKDGGLDKLAKKSAEAEDAQRVEEAADNEKAQRRAQIEKLGNADLKEIATDLGLDFAGNASNKALVELILEADADK